MEQFVKMLKNPNEEEINQEIERQREKGYKVVTIASSVNSNMSYRVLILFEKI